MAKKRTKAQRAEAARLSWARRKKGLPPLTPPKKKRKGKSRAQTHTVAVADLGVAVTQLIEPGYEMLAAELQAAFEQSARGKGKQRHNRGGIPFDRQPILELTRMYGPGFSAGQAAKKAQEALGMLRRGEKDAALAELHGAIVYLAAVAGHIREGK